MSDRPLRVAPLLWRYAKRDTVTLLAASLLFILSALALAFCVAALVHVFFAGAPRVQVSHLVPSELRHLAPFHQTLDRKDLAFTLPLLIIAWSFVCSLSAVLSRFTAAMAGARCAFGLQRAALGDLLRRQVPDDAAQALSARVVAVGESVELALRQCPKVLVCELPFAVLCLVLVAVLLPGVGVLAVACAMAMFAWLTVKYDASRFRRDRTERRLVAQFERRLRVVERHRALVALMGAEAREREDLQAVAEQAFSNRLFRSWNRVWRDAAITFLVPLTVAVAAVVWVEPVMVDGSGFVVCVILSAGAVAALRRVLKVIPAWHALQRARSTLAGLAEAYPVRAGELGQPRAPLLLEAHHVELEGMRHGVSLRVGAGERVALVGGPESGNAKFVRACAGIESFAGGVLRVVADAAFVAREPYVFEGTIGENLAFGIDGVPEPVLAARVRDMIQFLGLAHGPTFAAVVAERHVLPDGANLSVMERVRIGLGRVFLRNPPLLLLESPTSSLTASEVGEFWAILRSWLERGAGRSLVACVPAVLDNSLWSRSVVFSALVSDEQVKKEL